MPLSFTSPSAVHGANRRASLMTLNTAASHAICVTWFLMALRSSPSRTSSHCLRLSLSEGVIRHTSAELRGLRTGAAGSLPARAQRMQAVTGGSLTPVSRTSGTLGSGRRIGSPGGTKDGSPGRQRQRQPGVLGSFGKSSAPAGAKENSVHRPGNVTRHSSQIFRPCRGLHPLDTLKPTAHAVGYPYYAPAGACAHGDRRGLRASAPAGRGFVARGVSPWWKYAMSAKPCKGGRLRSGIGHAVMSYVLSPRWGCVGNVHPGPGADAPGGGAR